MTVVRNGGPGQTTTIGLRGAEAGQTLVLVDGVRINDPSTVDGEALLGDLLVNNIARIEVLRGPQSTLYGSDAIGGVVNILTKRGGPHPSPSPASAEGGSFDTYRLNAAANGTLAASNMARQSTICTPTASRPPTRATAIPRPTAAAISALTANTRYHLSAAAQRRSARLLHRRAHRVRRQLPAAGSIGSPIRRSMSATRCSPVYAGVNLALFDGHFRNRIAYLGSRSRRTVFDSPFYLPLHEDYAYRGEAQRFEYQGIVDLDARRSDHLRRRDRTHRA